MTKKPTQTSKEKSKVEKVAKVAPAKTKASPAKKTVAKTPNAKIVAPIKTATPTVASPTKKVAASPKAATTKVASPATTKTTTTKTATPASAKAIAATKAKTSTKTASPASNKNNEPPKKVAYVLCDRCELNYYIPNKNDKFCLVCAAELGYADKSLLIADEEELEKPCPVCKTNILAEDEDICFLCAKEKAKNVVEEEKDWSTDEPEKDTEVLGGGEIEISLELVAEEEEQSDEEDELANVEPLDEEPDDFDFDVNPDDFEGDEDDEFIDEPDEDDGDDDDDDDF